MKRVIINVYDSADNSGESFVRKGPGIYPTTIVFNLKEEE